MGCCSSKCCGSSKGASEKPASKPGKEAAPELGKTSVIEVTIKEAKELNNPEYRLGDNVQAFFGTEKWNVKVEVGCGSSASKFQTIPVIAKGSDAFINEMLILPFLADKSLTFSVYDEEGFLQDGVYGDPMFGQAELKLDDSVFGQDQLVKLTRSDTQKHHGNLVVHVQKAERQAREIVLLKSKIVTEAALCHWGLSLRDKDGNDHMWELNAPSFPFAGPLCIHGPTGVVGHSIPKEDIADFKKSLIKNRKNDNKESCEWAQKQHELGKDIPTDEFWKLFPCRPLANFSMTPVSAGISYYSNAEANTFIKGYLEAHPEYNGLTNSCQVFVSLLFRFLSGGSRLEDKTDQELVMGWMIALKEGNIGA